MPPCVYDVLNILIYFKNADKYKCSDYNYQFRNHCKHNSILTFTKHPSLTNI